MSSIPEDHSAGCTDEYAGGGLIATAVVFMTLETLFAALRHWANRGRGRKRGLDDLFIWPALVVNLVLCIEGLILIPLAGVGWHLVVVEARSPEKIVAWAKGIYACVWLWALAVALPKLAILGFYLRFFKVSWERAVSYILMIVIAATFFGTGLTATFQCTPVRYQWDRTVPNGRCINVTAFYRWMSLPNIVTDAIMLVLPLPMILKLNLTRSQRIGLAVIFATGGVGIITSCLRFAIFFDHDAFEDNTWTSIQLLKWTDIEPGIYFLAACMPSFRPLVHRFWTHFLAPYVKALRSDIDQRNDGGILALRTIGGGKRGHVSGLRSYTHTVGAFSMLSTGVDEETAEERYWDGQQEGVLTSVSSGSGGEGSYNAVERPHLTNSSPGIQVTETVIVDHS